MRCFEIRPPVRAPGSGVLPGIRIEPGPAPHISLGYDAHGRRDRVPLGRRDFPPPGPAVLEAADVLRLENGRPLVVAEADEGDHRCLLVIRAFHGAGGGPTEWLGLDAVAKIIVEAQSQRRSAVGLGEDYEILCILDKDADVHGERKGALPPGEPRSVRFTWDGDVFALVEAAEEAGARKPMGATA